MSDNTTAEPTTIDISTLPIFEWGENGLAKGVEYKYKEDHGVRKIDWRAMVNPKHIVVNTEMAKKDGLPEKLGKKLEEIKPVDVADKYLLILLAGIKEVAALRGFISVNPHVDFCSDTKCTITTNITWRANCETGGKEVTYGNTASAIYGHVGGATFDTYLETIADNRAFVRAVRNFLNIPILGRDEIKFGESNVMPESNENSTADAAKVATSYALPSPQNTLKNTAAAKGLTFEQIKNGSLKKYKDKISGDPTEWNDWADISGPDAMELTGILKAAKDSAKS